MIQKKLQKSELVLIVQCPYCKKKIRARNSGLTHYSCKKCSKPFFSFADIS